MKRFTTAVLLSLALLAISIVHTTPTHAAGATTVSDNQYVDGNWFQIAKDRGEEFTTGSPTQVALQAQIDAYKQAVSDKDLDKEVHFAIRSWVKGWNELALAENAMDSGDKVTAKRLFTRALRYGEAAQKSGAGLGEDPGRQGDDGADSFNGTSKIEGARVQAQAQKYLGELLAQ
jgi:hypothetical protein